jgi:hypothetical protein
MFVLNSLLKGFKNGLRWYPRNYDHDGAFCYATVYAYLLKHSHSHSHSLPFRLYYMFKLGRVIHDRVCPKIITCLRFCESGFRPLSHPRPLFLLTSSHTISWPTTSSLLLTISSLGFGWQDAGSSCTKTLRFSFKAQVYTQSQSQIQTTTLNLSPLSLSS